MGMLMDRRRALMSVQSGERILTGIVTVETGNQITIPATATNNFIVANNSVEAGTPMSSGEVVELFRLNALADRVYRIKNDGPTFTPPGLGSVGAMPTGKVGQMADSVTITCDASNTTGVAVVGSEYRYFIW